jgi:hypothetical protein
MDSLYWLLGIGIGLASVAGLRAFVPLTLVALSIQLLSGTPGWAVVGVLAALAVAEILLDKSAALERPLNAVMIPLRAIAGALVVAVVIDEVETFSLLGLFSGGGSAGVLSALAPWLAVGAVVAGAVAVAKFALRPRASTGGAGVSRTFLSLFEDVVALVGVIVGLFVPLLPLVLVVFLLFFFHRVRRRRGRKYEGLRILRD